MLKGLPGSGKSTKAKEIIGQGNWVRLNKDLLRKMLHFDKFTNINEKLTIDTEKHLARYFIGINVNVLVDDTNFGRYEDAWSGLCKELGCKFEKIEIETDIEECVKRDSTRDEDERVGKEVILNMAMRNGIYRPEKGFCLCDLDGTVADITHRLQYAKGEAKDWKKFFSLIHEDRPREEVIRKLIDFSVSGLEVVFVSARPEDYKKETIDWLEKNVVPRLPNGYLTLIMRRSGDKRPDTEVKKEVLDTYFREKDLVKVVIDDRPSVIRMWRENGLEVVDVGQGIEF